MVVPKLALRLVGVLFFFSSKNEISMNIIYTKWVIKTLVYSTIMSLSSGFLSSLFKLGCIWMRSGRWVGHFSGHILSHLFWVGLELTSEN